MSSFNFTTYTQKTGLKIQICVISKTIPGSIYCAICIIQMITPIILTTFPPMHTAWVYLVSSLPHPYVKVGTVIPVYRRIDRAPFLTCKSDPMAGSLCWKPNRAEIYFPSYSPKFIFGDSRTDALGRPYQLLKY